MPAAALRGALPAAALRARSSPGGRGRPNPARVRPQDAKYEEDFLSTIGVDFVRGAPPLAPSLPAAALALSVACWLVRPQKNRTVEIDGKQVKFQLVRAPATRR